MLRHSLTRSRFQLAVHVTVVLLVDALALMLLSELLPGFELRGPGAALGTAITIGLKSPAVQGMMLVLAVGAVALVLRRFSRQHKTEG